MNTLVLDVGGSNVKMLATGQDAPRKFPSGRDFTPEQLVKGVLEATKDWSYDAISIGVPGPVLAGRVAVQPPNLGRGWLAFDFQAAFGKPVKIINDAAMQALGSYTGGKMLFLGLGTGLGSAMIVDGIIEPMELGHLPYRKRTFEDYVGQRGLDRFGFKKWQRLVFDIIDRLRKALEPDYLVLGGGNVKKLTRIPDRCRIGNNANAFIGGFRLWEPTTSADNASRNDQWRNGGQASTSENDQPKQGTKA